MKRIILSAMVLAFAVAVQAGDTKQATIVLCELISKYGKTREARLARDKNIRCR